MSMVIIGGGSLALEVLSFISEKCRGIKESEWDVIHIVNPARKRFNDLKKVYSNLNFVSSVSDLGDGGDLEGLICVGDPAARYRLFHEHDGRFSRWATVIHPTAAIMPSAQVGEGTIVAPNTYIGPLAKIGPNVLINVGASVGHDAEIGHSSVICPQAAINGFAACGVGTFIGAAATMNPSSSLGPFSKLSAGSVFSGKVAEGFLLHGNPAKGRRMFRTE